MPNIRYVCFLIFFVTACKKDTSKKAVLIQQPLPKAELPIEPTIMLNKDFILGKFNYRTDTTFTKIDAQYASKTIFLKKEVYEAFKTMYKSALKDTIKLTVISGTRNFYEQKAIWERKWTKYKYLEPLERAIKILEYSSMPSTSRHHWGTDIDLINLNNSYFESGKGKKAYQWLIKHANSFGFYQVYTNKKNGRTGYNLEKWHWSYLPLASTYLNFYNEKISYDAINDFKGAALAETLNIIPAYVNGVSVKAKRFE